ncbi:MAG: response regulator [Nitrosomonadales bacterium]|nr:response regulator [Nitrosomonadales bacterium]
MTRILLVDDEQNVLNALRRELGGDYELETFDDPAAALEHCRATQFDLVIADYNMPGLNGIEFLKQFKQIQPDASRILLSGEADINTLIRTVNETHIYRFLSKPWERSELQSNIRQALAHHDAIMENRRQLANSKLASVPARKENEPYQIVMVDSDARLLALKARALAEEGGQANLYDAIQEDLNQRSLSRTFKCEVKSCTTAQEAIAFARSNRCDLVVTAQTLSDMDGIRLLKTMRSEHPNVVLILISSDPDQETMLKAINEAEVQGILSLYWTDSELRNEARRHAWNLHQLRIAAIQALAYRELVGNPLCRK